MTLIESMGSVVFARGPFEVELAAGPITILSPCFALDKVKIELIFYLSMSSLAPPKKKKKKKFLLKIH